MAGSQGVGLGDVKNHKGTPQLWLSTQSPLPGTVHHAMPSLLCPDGLQKEKKKSYEETIPVFYKASQGWSRALTYNPGFHPQNHPLQKKYTKHLVWLKTDPGEYSARADTFFRLTTGHL